MELLEQFVRRYARRTTQGGAIVLITDGVDIMVEAFKQLGWSDPYIDPLQLPVSTKAGRDTKATVEDAERAVMPKPKGRTGG